jgi:CBS-domain-containing membrane protein
MDTQPPLESVQPLAEPEQVPLRRKLGIKGELLLALLPTLMVLLVLFLIESLSRQRLLFASLASSAFLIYLDPQHTTNTARNLALSHLSAAVVGAATLWAIGDGYVAAATAMVITIIVMVTADIVHPPAVSTALGFAFRAENVNGMILFLVAVTMICALVSLQRVLLWSAARLMRSPR